MTPEGIPDAIRRSMKILATHRALFGQRGRERKSMSEIDIVRVVEVFEANQAGWAVIGAHAIEASRSRSEPAVDAGCSE